MRLLLVILAVLLVILVALVASSQVMAAPFPAGRYCVTPLFGNATDRVYVLSVVIDVAPPTATGGKGAIVNLKFKTAAEAKMGARGACWRLKPAPVTETRRATYLVEGAAP